MQKYCRDKGNMQLISFAGRNITGIYCGSGFQFHGMTWIHSYFQLEFIPLWYRNPVRNKKLRRSCFTGVTLLLHSINPFVKFLPSFEPEKVYNFIYLYTEVMKWAGEKVKKFLKKSTHWNNGKFLKIGRKWAENLQKYPYLINTNVQHSNIQEEYGSLFME